MRPRSERSYPDEPPALSLPVGAGLYSEILALPVGCIRCAVGSRRRVQPAVGWWMRCAYPPYELSGTGASASQKGYSDPTYPTG